LGFPESDSPPEPLLDPLLEPPPDPPLEPPLDPLLDPPLPLPLPPLELSVDPPSELSGPSPATESPQLGSAMASTTAHALPHATGAMGPTALDGTSTGKGRATRTPAGFRFGAQLPR
jgi:hypothetical protein